ncbi:hypothetical protein Emag_004973 [Eimeria magna]
MDAVTAAVTSYVATRWYRAPELLTGGLEYGSAVDLWAAGCIMGELIDQQPLFPGDSDIDQLYRIQLVLGPITDEQLRALSASPRWQRLALTLANGLIPFEPIKANGTTLQQRLIPYSRFDRVALDFLQRLLTMEPQGRMTAAEALNHPYLRHFEQCAPHRLIQPPPAASRSPYFGNFVRQQKQALPKAVHRRQVAKAVQLEAVVEGHEVALPQRPKAFKTHQQVAPSLALKGLRKKWLKARSHQLASLDDYITCCGGVGSVRHGFLAVCAYTAQDAQNQRSSQPQPADALRVDPEDARMDEEPPEDWDWQQGSSDGSIQQQQHQQAQPLQQQQQEQLQQQQQWQRLHLAEDWSHSRNAKQPEETFALHSPSQASETEAPPSKREMPASLEPMPHPILQGTAHKAEERKPQPEPQCVQQQQQHRQQQQPRGTRLAAGSVNMASRVAEKAQHAKSQETVVHKEGGVESCGPAAADEAAAAQRVPQSRKQQAGAPPPRPAMQLNGLALRVLNDSRSSGAMGGLSTPPGQGAARGEHAAAVNHAGTIQKSTASDAPALPAPIPAHMSPTFVRCPNAGRGPRTEQHVGPQMPQLLQQPFIDLTLQQAARLIELDGISLKQRARPRQLVSQQTSSLQNQQQQNVQQQQPMMRQAADESQEVCSTAAAQQGPPKKWPFPSEAPGQAEDHARRRVPSREIRRLSFEVSRGATSEAMQMPRSQAKTQLPPFRQRSHSREFSYQQQQQALLRRMQQQQRQAVQRRQQRVMQLNEQRGWTGSVNPKATPEATAWAPQATAAWQQLLAAAAPHTLKSKSIAFPAAACYSMSTALEPRPGVPEAPNHQQHAPGVQIDMWGQQQHMQQQRKPQAKVTCAQPPQGDPSRRLVQPGPHPPFFGRDNLNQPHQGPFIRAPVMPRAAEASPSLGLDAQGSRWIGATPQAHSEEARVPPALAVPPVGCATSYEELIAFFRGLAEQQRMARQEGMGLYHEGQSLL